MKKKQQQEKIRKLTKCFVRAMGVLGNSKVCDDGSLFYIILHNTYTT